MASPAPSNSRRVSSRWACRRLKSAAMLCPERRITQGTMHHIRLEAAPNNYRIDRVSGAPSVIARSTCDEAGATDARPLDCLASLTRITESTAFGEARFVIPAKAGIQWDACEVRCAG